MTLSNTGVLTVQTSISTATINATTYQVGGVAANVGSLTGVTAGSALASKALILDSATNIKDINSLTCGALTTASIINSGITQTTGIVSSTYTDLSGD